MIELKSATKVLRFIYNYIHQSQLLDQIPGTWMTQIHGNVCVQQRHKFDIENQSENSKCAVYTIQKNQQLQSIFWIKYSKMV